VIPPVTTASLVIFIVARTTREPHGSVRKETSFKYGVTNRARRALSEISVAALTLLKSAKKSCLQRDLTLI
jgi:hypothetical protein